MVVKLRAGELRHVVADVRDQDNNPITYIDGIYNLNLSGVAQIFDDPSDPTNQGKTLVSGEAPGSVNLSWTASDFFADPIGASEGIQVVDAVAFRLTALSGPNLQVISTPTGFNMLVSGESTPSSAAKATPIDEFLNVRTQSGTPPPTPMYVSGLTNISWTASQGKIMFDIGGGPVAGPVTDVLELSLIPVEGGTEILEIRATNSLGFQILTEVPIKILNPTLVTLLFSTEP